MIKLVAMVDKKGCAGYVGVPARPADQHDLNAIGSKLAWELHDCIVVIGSTTSRMVGNPRSFRTGEVERFSSGRCRSPEAFLKGLQRQNPAKDIAIGGGVKTFATFLPFVDQVILIRTELWQPGYAGAPLMFPFHLLTGS